jgi:hypothetical protein
LFARRRHTRELVRLIKSLKKSCCINSPRTFAGSAAQHATDMSRSKRAATR